MNATTKPTAGPLVVDTNTDDLPFRVYSKATQGNVAYFLTEADARRFAAHDALVNELVLAGKILTEMLNALPTKKMFELAKKLEKKGVSPDGMVRLAERERALAAAGVQQSAPPEGRHV